MIWENASGKVSVRYDDIMKIAFPKKYKKNKIVVIPVNTCFDTQVDEDIARCDKPLVLNNPVPVSLLSGDRKPQIRFLGNHHSGSGNLYHKSFRM